MMIRMFRYMSYFPSKNNSFRIKYTHSSGGPTNINPKIPFHDGHLYFMFEGDFETHTPGKFASRDAPQRLPIHRKEGHRLLHANQDVEGWHLVPNPRRTLVKLISPNEQKTTTRSPRLQALFQLQYAGEDASVTFTTNTRQSLAGALSDTYAYCNFQFVLLPNDSPIAFPSNACDLRLINTLIRDQRLRLDKLREDVDPIKPSKDDPKEQEDEPPAGNPEREKTSVWYRCKCSHNDSRNAAFNGPHKMNPGDVFNHIGRH